MSASNSPSAKGSASALASTNSIEPWTLAAGFGEHAGALVDADDAAALLANELERDGAGPGRDVEDAAGRPGLDPGDEEATPARVLSEREERSVALVGRAERREDPFGVLGAFH